MNDRVITYRLQRSRLALLLTCLLTGLIALVFARGWSRVPERPWFAMALVLTLLLGGLAAWGWARRWHTVTVTAEPPRLRVHGLFRSRDFDLAGAELYLMDFTVRGRAMHPGAAPVTVRTSGRRSALHLRTPHESLVIHALGGRSGRVSALATRLQRELGLELTHGQATRSRIGFASYTDHGRRTVILNPDLGSPRPFRFAGLVGLGTLLLLFAPVALQEPSYRAAVAETPQPVIDEWTTYLAAEKVTPAADPGPVEVQAEWRVCERASSWLWGDSDVARLEVTVGLPVAAEEEPGVRERLDELLQRRDWEHSTDWTQPDLRSTVTLKDGQLTTRMVHACLPAPEQERAEEELSALLATWLLWLADAPQT